MHWTNIRWRECHEWRTSRSLAEIQEQAPHAYYFHCFNHKLNLALVDSARSVDIVGDMLEIIVSIFNFFSGSVVHEEFSKPQQMIQQFDRSQDPQVRSFTLKRPADTRWASRYECCVDVCNNLQAMLNILEVLETCRDPSKRDKALVLYNQINTSFLASFGILKEVLKIINRLSVALQKEQLDYSDAVDMIGSSKDRLIELPTCYHFDHLWETFAAKLASAAIPIPIVRQLRRVRDDYSASRWPTTKDDFRKDVLQPIEQHDK